MDPEIEDKKILEDFIKIVQEKRQNLLLIFEHFDTNNNGCITREEFKYALGQLGIELDDKNITKLIFLVSGDAVTDKDVNIQNLDSSDSFNYIEFCKLFEQKSKNYLLKQKRQYLNKNKMQIDWKLNALTVIILQLDKNHILIDDAFNNRDRSEKGYLTFDEFDLFLNSIEAKLDNNKKRLFDYFDEEKNGHIEIDKLKKALYQAKLQSDEYQKLNMSYSISNKVVESEKEIKNKYIKLTEEKKYYEIKIKNLEKRLENSEESNSNLSKEIDNYKKQSMENVEKYLEAERELQNLREEFEDTGVKKADYLKLQHENESLKREVVLLRIGMNTFKELYNASNLQIKHINLNEKKNLDELDMYKRALKELQGESNQNNLIGKLYYTVLISRWREAHTLRNYGELINDFGSLKEENIILEKENKLLQENLQQVNETLHKEIIENIKMMDKIENLENGILDGSIINKNTNMNPLEEMKKLVAMLKEDKKKKTLKN
jgi:Ca2+-binding EF-hand superfamily protein